MNAEVKTIIALLSAEFSSNGAVRNAVVGEFQDILRCGNISDENKRHLLMVLYATRGLDSSLKAHLDSIGFINASNRSQIHSLGKYLVCYESNSRLSSSQRDHYQRRIVKKRNKYMHNAGTRPANKIEVEVLIKDMVGVINDVL